MYPILELVEKRTLKRFRKVMKTIGIGSSELVHVGTPTILQVVGDPYEPLSSTGREHPKVCLP